MCASPNAPTRQFRPARSTYRIDPLKCTECVGHFDEPQCQRVCPVECIPFNPDVVETKEQLYKKVPEADGVGGGAQKGAALA